MGDKRVPKSKERLWQELVTELQNLRIACEQWELDNFEQTTAIATSLRVLLYDKGATPESLFAQLNLKSNSFFATPALQKIPNAKQPGAVLATHSAEGWITPGVAENFPSGRWTPQYYHAGIVDSYDKSSRLRTRRLSFIEWWRESVLWNGTFRMSRADIILALCNELGGTHAAAMLKLETATMLSNAESSTAGAFLITIGGSAAISLNKNYDAVIRQIAYEVQRTVQRNFQKQIENTSVVPPLPDGWRLDESGIQIQRDHQYLRKVLTCFESENEGNTLAAEEIRTECYWSDYRAKMRRSGI